MWQNEWHKNATPTHRGSGLHTITTCANALAYTTTPHHNAIPPAQTHTAKWQIQWQNGNSATPTTYSHAQTALWLYIGNIYADELTCHF